jgi:hypothetical protein
MIAQDTITQIQHASIVERIQVIEVILQSLKQDMQPTLRREHPHKKVFKVRRFHLGQEVHCDRDEIYAERS